MAFLTSRNILWYTDCSGKDPRNDKRGPLANIHLNRYRNRNARCFRLKSKTTKNSLSTYTTTRYGYKTIFIVSGCCKWNMMTVWNFGIWNLEFGIYLPFVLPIKGGIESINVWFRLQTWTHECSFHCHYIPNQILHYVQYKVWERVVVRKFNRLRWIVAKIVHLSQSAEHGKEV